MHCDRSVTFAAVLLVLGGCATSEEPRPADARERIPVREAAAELGLSVRESGVPGEVRLVARDGRAFELAAGRATYAFEGSTRIMPPPGLAMEGRTLLLPRALLDAMQRDLELPRGVATLPPSTEPTRPRGAPREIRGLAVVVDPGHGGKDPGAVGAGNLTEKALVLEIGRRVASILESRGAAVKVTRKGDAFVELEERAAIANRNRAALFVSLHLNAAANRDAQGVEVFHPEGGTRGRESAAVARAIARSVAAAAATPNRGAKVDRRGLRVLQATEMPAVLVEMGFLTNAAEAQRLKDPEHQQKLAEAIADGIESWLRI